MVRQPFGYVKELNTAANDWHDVGSDSKYFLTLLFGCISLPVLRKVAIIMNTCNCIVL